MFQFPGFPSYNYGFIARYRPLRSVGFPIRKSADQCLFTATRSLSQLVTSFFGSWCQGIRPALLLAWPFRPLVLSTIIWVFLWNCLPFRKNFFVFTLFSFQGTSSCLFQDTSISSIPLIIWNYLKFSLFSYLGLPQKPCFCDILVEMRRVELLTPCLQGRCSPNWATPPFFPSVLLSCV